MVGRGAGGPARGRRRRTQRRGRASRVRARHVQRVLSHGRSLAGDPGAGARAARTAVAARPGRPRAPTARAGLGPPAPGPGGHRRPDGLGVPRGRAGLARPVRRLGPDREPPGRRTAHPLPAGPSRLGRTGPAPRGRRPGFRPNPAHIGDRAGHVPLRWHRAPHPAGGQRGAQRHPPRRPGLGRDGTAADDAGPDGRVPGPGGRRRQAQRCAGPSVHRARAARSAATRR